MKDQAFWQNCWQDNRINWHESTVHPLLPQYLTSLKLSPGNSIFVPFCGASLDMVYLMQQGYRVLGCEISPIACQRFFADNELTYQ